MDIEIILRNYRCFQLSHPIQLHLQKGFTAFVGVNNSGKSTLLKFFYELRPVFQAFSYGSSYLTDAMTKGTDQVRLGPSVKDPSDIFFDGNDQDLEIDIRLRDLDLDSTNLHPLTPNRMVIKGFRPKRNQSLRWGITFYQGRKQLHGENFGWGQTEEGKMLITGGNFDIAISPIFSIFELLCNCLYVGPFRNAINSQPEDNYFDIQVGRAFINSWHINKNGDQKSRREAIYKVTDDIRRIFEFDNLDINTLADEKDLQIRVNDRTYKLTELGSGLAQFIIVLGNAAVCQPSFILIDEPELNLHPKLQLDFLTSLATYATEGILFATHSIGLARAISERVYSVRRSKDDVRKVVALEKLPRLSEFLGELGFSGYRELGFDKILLVEGPSDVTAVQQLLRKFGNDHQILILPLGGSSLINGSDSTEAQLLEITRITNKIFALIDSERSSQRAPLEQDRQAFVELCNRVGINCHVLKLRAMENYFPDHVVKKVKSPKYSALKPYESVRGVKPPWNKADNWEAAREMTEAELNATDLGRFLKKI